MLYRRRGGGRLPALHLIELHGFCAEMTIAASSLGNSYSFKGSLLSRKGPSRSTSISVEAKHSTASEGVSTIRFPAILNEVLSTTGSCRVQTVSRDDNPGFYKVIQAFQSLTGVPVVLNTSFNIAGNPIVETPSDAVECFASTDIDVLLLGPFLLSKLPLKEYELPRDEAAIVISAQNP